MMARPSLCIDPRLVIHDIQLGGVIKRGANAVVSKANWKGIAVAVKQFGNTLNELTGEQLEKARDEFLWECERVCRLGHPNLVQIFGINYPTGSAVQLPSVVMELLHCSLSDVLDGHTAVSADHKRTVLHDISTAIRYLHSRQPAIVLCDLSSENILMFDNMRAKVSVVSTVHILRSTGVMSVASGTQEFLPPEVFTSSPTDERDIDIFSFGCVMLHIYSQQWPVPAPAVIPDVTTRNLIPQSEVEKRATYFEKVDHVMLPIIKRCLSNVPSERPKIEEICYQLKGLVRLHMDQTCDIEQKLQKQVDHLTAELEQATLDPSKKVNKSNAEYWNSKNIKWSECAKLPWKLSITSVAVLDGRVYTCVTDGSNSYTDPIMYDLSKDEWSALPPLPHARFSLVSVPDRNQLLAIGGSGIQDGVRQCSDQVYLWDPVYSQWIFPYPNMPTARDNPSAVGHQLSVIVAGGKTCYQPLITTRAVEVLHVNSKNIKESRWITVAPLPFAVEEAISLVVADQLYVAGGYIAEASTRGVVSCSLAALMSSSSSSVDHQVWEKMADLPYCTEAISHHQDHVIIFSGDYKVESDDGPKWQLFSAVHVYNPVTDSWDHVDDVPFRCLLGKSAHLTNNDIMFVGGLTGGHDTGSSDDLITTCYVISIMPN